MNGIKLKIKVNIKFEDKTVETSYFHLIPFLSTRKKKKKKQHILPMMFNFKYIPLLFLIQNENLFDRIIIHFFLPLIWQHSRMVNEKDFSSLKARPVLDFSFVISTVSTTVSLPKWSISVLSSETKKRCVCVHIFFLSYTHTYTCTVEN